jgi:hypothetical protein
MKLKIAFVAMLAYVVASGYGVYRALTWRP